MIKLRFLNPGRNNYNTLLNFSCFSGDKRKEKNTNNIYSNNSTSYKTKFQERGKEVKEKIANETKNIILLNISIILWILNKFKEINIKKIIGMCV